MARQHLMSGKDSVTGARYTWVSGADPDFAGTGYPGPNSATNVYVQSLFDDGTGIPGPPGSDLSRDPIQVAAVTNIALTGTYTHQGVALTAGMRVGAFGQTDGAQGGVYVVAAGAWSRATDFDSSGDCIAGMGGLILQGTYNGGRWTLITDGATLGTTPLTFNVEPFVDVAGADGVALTVASGVPSLTKIGDAQIDDNTIAVGKLASGGAGNNGLVATVVAGMMALAAPAVTGVTPKNESGTPLTQATSIQGQWWDVTSPGGAALIKPHVKAPRARVRAASTGNYATPLSISTTIDGLSGASALKVGDAVLYWQQTTAAQNGLYRVSSISGSTATMIKLSNVDAIIADNGLYVQIVEGATFGGTIRKVSGNGSLAASVAMPDVTPDFFAFDEASIEDFVVTGDSLSVTAGNWHPVVRRALECMFMAGGRIWFGSGQTYRFTTRIDLWTTTELCGVHTPTNYTTTGPRLVFDGCAGFFSPASGGETWESVVWDAGIVPFPQLRGLNCLFSNGSTDDHYGALFHSRFRGESLTFRNPYGRGLSGDSTGAPGGLSGSYLNEVTIYGAGLSAFHILGGDANNLLMLHCRGTNFASRGVEAVEYEVGGTATFPGDDWGLLDESFLGCCLINCNFSAFHNGGIFSENSLSIYIKTYQESGTESDITGCAVIGGMVLRTGGNAGYLPLLSFGTDNVARFQRASFQSDAAVLQCGNGDAGFLKFAGLSGDTTGYNYKWNTSGGSTGLVTIGHGTATASQDHFWTQSTHALGRLCEGNLRGHWIGTGCRVHVIARASLPATGVPLSAGAANAFDGPYPVGSIVHEPTPGLAASAYRVLTNSGSAAYNLTWGAIPNAGCDVVALADGNQTRVITDGGRFVMPATTTTGASVITLGTTGALKGDVMRFTIRVQGHNVTLTNGGAGGTGAMANKVVTAGVEAYGEYQFNGTDWVGYMTPCI